MDVFKKMADDDFEQVVFCQDKQSGLQAIIALHNTTLGPALGGTRMWTYESEEAALEDVLRLAKGMTYKNAAAGLNLGGGKGVIIGDARQDKNEAMFRMYGRFIQGLNGRYITAEDVGTTVADMETIRLETKYVTGTSLASGSSGNPAPMTAYGIYRGMQAAAKAAFGTDSLAGKTVAVQGVGNVAYELCKYLHKDKANLVVTDIDKKAVDRAVRDFQATAVNVEDIYKVDCDIFSPCAFGGVINDQTIPLMKAKVIAGSANNQLKEPRHGDLLHKKGIVYAPDYVINAGGVLNVACELEGYHKERALKKIATIYENIDEVISIAKRDQIPTYLAADRMAEERIARAKRLS